MASFTTQVRTICESQAKISGYTGADPFEIVKNAYPRIFLDFPIYDESHREELCTKILLHYYMDEIGLETYALWKLQLNIRMREIMPFFNTLYETLGESDLFSNVNMGRTYTKSGTSDTKSENLSTSATAGNNQSDGHSVDKYSETPQGGLSGIESDKYLTNARITSDSRKDTSTASTEGKANFSENGNSNEKYEERTAGKDGGASYMELLQEYSNKIVTIDNQIIENLSNLFMGVWV